VGSLQATSNPSRRSQRGRVVVGYTWNLPRRL